MGGKRKENEVCEAVLCTPCLQRNLGSAPRVGSPQSCSNKTLPGVSAHNPHLLGSWVAWHQVAVSFRGLHAELLWAPGSQGDYLLASFPGQRYYKDFGHSWKRHYPDYHPSCHLRAHDQEVSLPPACHSPCTSQLTWACPLFFPPFFSPSLSFPQGGSWLLEIWSKTWE